MEKSLNFKPNYRIKINRICLLKNCKHWLKIINKANTLSSRAYKTILLMIFHLLKWLVMEQEEYFN